MRQRVGSAAVDLVGGDMFFRKKRTKTLTKGSPLNEIAWDEETVKWIAQSDHLEVKITHINKTISLGGRNDDRFRSEGSTQCEVHGLITFPKFIPVKIGFVKDEKQFGGFYYDRSHKHDFSDERKINLPVLEVWLSDNDEQKAQLLIGALRDAILSGRKYAGVRLFKKEGEGLMTPTDEERGYSYQSRYSVFGLVTWQELHASRLPKWTLPTDYQDFSLADLPEWRSDLDSKLEK
jgi:hypothetical protein